MLITFLILIVAGAGCFLYLMMSQKKIDAIAQDSAQQSALVFTGAATVFFNDAAVTPLGKYFLPKALKLKTVYSVVGDVKMLASFYWTKKYGNTRSSYEVKDVELHANLLPGKKYVLFIANPKVLSSDKIVASLELDNNKFFGLKVFKSTMSVILAELSDYEKIGFWKVHI